MHADFMFDLHDCVSGIPHPPAHDRSPAEPPRPNSLPLKRRLSDAPLLNKPTMTTWMMTEWCNYNEMEWHENRNATQGITRQWHKGDKRPINKCSTFHRTSNQILPETKRYIETAHNMLFCGVFLWMESDMWVEYSEVLQMAASLWLQRAAFTQITGD